MKKRLFLIILVIGVLLINAPQKLFAQQKTTTVAFKMDTVFRAYNHSHGPGVAVAIIQNGKVTFKKGYGMANLEYGIPVTSSTVFDVASVSKQFTGLAISILVQEGKISVDDDIHHYLPDLPNYGKKITVAQLLHHTSGIRDCFDALVAAGWRWDDVFSFEDVINMSKRQKELNFEPGSEFSYCNTEYNLLQAVVEKISGKTFPEWTDEQIFKPLGMQSSHFVKDFSVVIKNIASPYDARNKAYTRDLQQSGTISLFSTIDDLSKWVIHFQQALLAKDPVYVRMAEDGTLNDGEKTGYGFGLVLGEDHGLKTISHTGAWGGYRANIRNYPDQKFALVTLSNAGDDELSGRYASQIAAIFLKDQFRTGEVEKIKILPTVQLDTNILKKYTGTFQLGAPANKTLSFTIEKGQLIVHVATVNLPMEAKSGHAFFVPADNSSIIFGKNTGGGNVDEFSYQSGSLIIAAKRITPDSTKFSPTAEQLKSYSGTYYSDELEAQYKVAIVAGKLSIHHFRRGDFELLPDAAKSDQFTGDVGNIVFFKDSSQHVAGFLLSGERIRNIRFNKTDIN